MGDSLTELAEAGEAVLGDSEWVLETQASSGTWLFSGAVVAILLAGLLHMRWWEALLVALGLGAAANEREKRQIKRRLAEVRAAELARENF